MTERPAFAAEEQIEVYRGVFVSSPMRRPVRTPSGKAERGPARTPSGRAQRAPARTPSGTAQLEQLQNAVPVAKKLSRKRGIRRPADTFRRPHGLFVFFVSVAVLVMCTTINIVHRHNLREGQLETERDMSSNHPNGRWSKIRRRYKSLETKQIVQAPDGPPDRPHSMSHSESGSAERSYGRQVKMNDSQVDLGSFGDGSTKHKVQFELVSKTMYPDHKDGSQDVSVIVPVQAYRWEDVELVYDDSLKEEVVRSEVDESDRPCQYMADWQRKSFPTCNIMHEFASDLSRYEKTMKLLGDGLYRVAWKVLENDNESSKFDQGRDLKGLLLNEAQDQDLSLVFRTLKFKQPLTAYVMEQNRVDSLAMERLSGFSSYGMQQYAFCAASVVTEVGVTLEKLVTHSKEQEYFTSLERLKIGVHVAKALRDIHSIPDGKGTKRNESDSRPSLAHGDFHRENILMNSQGNIVANDFNQGMLLRWNNKNNTACRYQNQGYRGMSRYDRPPERYTEKLIYPDKVDVFGLGNILVYILTGTLRPHKAELLKIPVKDWGRPRVLHVSRQFLNTNDTATLAMLHASLACYSFHPLDRPSASRVEQGLETALHWMQDGKTESTVDEIKALFADDDRIFAKVDVRA